MDGGVSGLEYWEERHSSWVASGESVLNSWEKLVCWLSDGAFGMNSWEKLVS